MKMKGHERKWIETKGHERKSKWMDVKGLINKNWYPKIGPLSSPPPAFVTLRGLCTTVPCAICYWSLDSLFFLSSDSVVIKDKFACCIVPQPGPHAWKMEKWKQSEPTMARFTKSCFDIVRRCHSSSFEVLSWKTTICANVSSHVWDAGQSSESWKKRELARKSRKPPCRSYRRVFRPSYYFWFRLQAPKNRGETWCHATGDNAH